MEISFTGIANPHSIGAFGVDANAKILQRYRFIHERLMFISAAQLPARHNWDVKTAMGRHIYEDAEAADQLRTRVSHLRTPLANVGQEPDPALTLLMDEILHARTDSEWLAGVYTVIKPALIEAYRSHIQRTQQIVDQPTIRILRSILLDLEEQVTWGGAVIAHLKNAGEWEEAGSEELCTLLKRCILAAGGMSNEMKRSSEIPERIRSFQVYQLPKKSQREARMGETTLYRTSMGMKFEKPNEDRLVGMMRVRQEEMTAAELIAAVLWSQKGMPWAFYRDLARHLWDEVRHALFGQAALEAEGLNWRSRPQYTSDYDINIEKIPSAQYAWLSIGIEEGAMKRPGKVGEFEFCRDQVKHPLMTQFQDYDWADEVVHASFGRTWTPELFGEELGFIREVAKHELDHFFSEVRKAEEIAAAEGEI
ncbi:MAG: hypothetical protein K0Q73_2070 [Paenibacillus sp.]|nr:hypothetical protein [Paenibacillus sp.]